jgi:glycosyltransferase involved in cell wall biosynthesis
MRLAVVMCTYNPRHEIMLRALDAIVDQINDVSTAEIVVVDNNSDPPLAERGYLTNYPIRLIREPRPGLTAAREAAIDNTQADLIVFVDDDNILERGYLSMVVQEFAAEPKLGLLGGRIVPEYEGPPAKWFGEFESWLAVRPYSPGLRIETTKLPNTPPYAKYFPVGAGFATRRDLAVAHKAHCLETTRIEGRKGQVLSSGEDLDFGFFVLSQGYKLVVTGALSVTHVIGSGRLRVEYLQRLAAGSIRSAWTLNEKWSPRFDRQIYPMLSMPMVNILARAMVAAALGLGLHRYRIKRCVYTTLVRARLVAAMT